jgi:hypothetical protein
LQSLIRITAEKSPIGILLSPDCMELKAVADTIAAYTKLDSKQSRFPQFSCTSKANNLIGFEIDPKTLLNALKSAEKSSVEVYMSLTNRDEVKCLTLRTETAQGIVVIQDVPLIKLLRIEDMAYYREPRIPDPQVCLRLPDLRKLKSVLDRIKQLDKTLVLKCSEVTGLNSRCKMKW